jgi:hypothetical protein
LEEKYRLLLAVGNEDLENEIKKIPGTKVVDSDSDIEIITDILNYEKVDYVIVNTVLSEEKSLELAQKAKEKPVKVIALVESHKNMEFIAALVGFGVKAFLQHDETKRISEILDNYPEEFDFAKFQNRGNDTGSRTAGIREKLFGAAVNRDGPKSKPPSKSVGGRIVGIIAAAPGTGATSLCVGYGAYLTGQKRRIILLDRTENQQLSSISIKGQDIDSCPLYDINIHKYNDVLIDFGPIAQIGPSDKITLKDELRNEKKMERQYCSRMVLVCSSLPWRLKELTVYIDHPIFKKLTEDWIFYINGENNALFESLRKNYEKERTFLTSFECENPFETLSSLLDSRI